MADERKMIWLPTSAFSRRKFIVAGSAAAFLAACGGDDDSASTTAPGTAAPGTAAPGTTGAPATTGAPGTTTGATTAPGGTAPVGIKGGILRVGTGGGSNDLLDGQHIVSKADIIRQVTGWEPLLNFNPSYQVVNTDSLAEEFETIAADHYVVRLKEGLMFSDGKPVRAEDVIYSFQRMLDPDLALYGGAALRPIMDPTGITKVDDRSVDIKLKQLVANFNENLCGYTCAIVPEGYERFAGDPTNQIGTAAYKLQEFEVGVQSIHTRNEFYWDTGKPYFDEVHIIDFADSDAMINALLADQLDCCQDIPATAVDTLKNQGFGALNAAGGGWLTIFMAVDQEPFTDVRVRQAMRLIVDRQGMVDQVLGGYGSVANDLYSPLDAAYIGDELPQRKQDIEAAKALLADAGQSDLEIELFAPNDTAGLPELVQAFATMAQDAGINVKPVIMDGSYWGDEYLKRTFGVDFWGTRNFLPQVASSSLPTAPYPDDHWPPADSTFIDDYNAAVAEIDLDKRKVITDKMQNELYDTGGLIIPFFQNQLDGFNNRVKGLVERANTLNLDHYGRGFKNLYFEE